MKLKQMMLSGKQMKKAGKMFSAAKDAGVLDKLKPSRNGDEEEQQEGVGEGRRMPIQQSVDIAAPVESVWKLWNKYEDYPKFMHRLESAEKTGWLAKGTVFSVAAAMFLMRSSLFRLDLLIA